MIKRGRVFLWFLWVLVTLIAILHLLRAVLGLKLTLIAESTPIWASYVFFFVMGTISYFLLHFLRKKHKNNHKR